MPYTLAAISLLAPVMLAGLVLASLPVLAHLLNRRARRTLVFPTIALLKASSASQAQLFKLRRWLLLVLRVLAVGLIVFTFARPLWVSDPLHAVTAGGGAAVVMLVDASASTAQRIDGVAADELIRSAGARALDELVSGADQVNLIIAADRPQVVFPQMTSNLPAVRSELERVTPTPFRADLAAALAEAARLLARADRPGKLVILSDLQAANWDDALAQPLPQNTRVTIVPLDGPEPGNVALSRPTLDPADPVAGQPVQLRVTVTHHGTQARTADITATLDGQPLDTKTVTLEARQPREVSFDARLEPGSHVVRFEVGDDALLSDNAIHLIARAVRRVPIAVLGDDGPDAVGSTSYFLHRALAPHNGEADRYDVTQLTGNDPIGQARVVFVSDVGALSDEALQRLHEYVDQGGVAVAFTGDSPADAALMQLNALGEGRGAPWLLTGMQSDGPIRLGEMDRASPIVRAFDERSRLALSDIGFARVWRAAEPDPGTRVLLRFADGSPAVGYLDVGAGRLAVVNFSPASDAGDLGKRGAFVALVHALAEGLAPSHTERDRPIVGRPLTFSSHAAVSRDGPAPAVLDPTDTPVADASYNARPDGLDVYLPRAAMPGVYAATQDGAVLGRAAVDPDPRESDLRRVDAAVLAERLTRQGAEVAVYALEADDEVLALRGKPVWGYLLLAAMGLLAVEMALLGYWRR